MQIKKTTVMLLALVLIMATIAIAGVSLDSVTARPFTPKLFQNPSGNDCANLGIIAGGSCINTDSEVCRSDSSNGCAYTCSTTGVIVNPVNCLTHMCNNGNTECLLEVDH